MKIVAVKTAAIAVGVALTLLACSASGASILLNPPSGWNGFVFFGTIQAGFRESSGVGRVETASSTFMLAGPGSGAAPGQVFNSTPVSVMQLPTLGAAKDVAGGGLSFSYTVGSADPSTYDRFDISLNSSTSASDALVNFGGGLVHADAYFRAVLSLQTAGPINSSIGAYFGLPDMPALSSPTTETMIAKVTKGLYASPGTLATLFPGDTGVDIPLTMATWSEAFTYTFTYEIVTPYGSDPTYSYDLSGAAGAAAVPEPSTLALLGLGSLGLAACRRKRTAQSAG